MLTEFHQVPSICRHGSRCILSGSISSDTYHDYFVAVSFTVVLSSRTSTFAVVSGRRERKEERERDPFPFDSLASTSVERSPLQIGLSGCP